jgi:hypothetical protein
MRLVAPRLVGATCPQCGAAVKIAPGQDVVTCAYCNKSSFIHRPGDKPVTPPPMAADYGHIHLPAASAATMVPVVAAIGVLAVGGVVAGVLTSVSGRSQSSVWQSPGRSPSPVQLPSRPSMPAVRATDKARVEISSLVQQATEEARKIESRAQLVSVVAFKAQNGLADVSGDKHVSMTFEYLYSDPKKPPGDDQVSGMINVVARNGELNVSSQPGWPASRLKHADKMGGALEVPRCTSDRMWQAATQSGVPANAIADIHLYGNAVFTPKSPLVWSIRVEGHDEYRREIDAHTCVVAKNWAKR